MEWFRSRPEAKVIIEAWRQHYNQVRPHSSLAYRTPVEFRRHHESIQLPPILELYLVRNSGDRSHLFDLWVGAEKAAPLGSLLRHRQRGMRIS